MYAAWKGHLQMVTYLVESGADIEATTEVSDVMIDMKPHIAHRFIHVL